MQPDSKVSLFSYHHQLRTNILSENSKEGPQILFFGTSFSYSNKSSFCAKTASLFSTRWSFPKSSQENIPVIQSWIKISYWGSHSKRSVHLQLALGLHDKNTGGISEWMWHPTRYGRTSFIHGCFPNICLVYVYMVIQVRRVWKRSPKLVCGWATHPHVKPCRLSYELRWTITNFKSH